MATISALNYALTAQITLLDGLITGLREIHSLGSILQVGRLRLPNSIE
jgi:hypothetical protein